MTSDSDKVDQSVTKGEAVIVLLAWKAQLWSIRSKGDPPEAVSASAVSDVGGRNGGGVEVAVTFVLTPRLALAKNPLWISLLGPW